jgi:hypothetical protein
MIKLVVLNENIRSRAAQIKTKLSLVGIDNRC